MLIAAVDVGSIRRQRFAWSALDLETTSSAVGGTHPTELVESLVSRLADGHQVALGFECPLVLPVPDAAEHLGAARVGEPTRAWSASAGASAMATGLVQLAWVLKHIGTVQATTQPARWSPDTPLLLWEAFVSGDLKTRTAGPTGHRDDADSAVRGFVARLDDLDRLGDVHLGHRAPLNLAAAVALQAGLSISTDEIAMQLLIVSGTAAEMSSAPMPPEAR